MGRNPGSGVLHPARIASAWQIPYFSLPSRLPFWQQRLPLSCGDVKIGISRQNTCLPRKLLPHIDRLGSKPADHQLAHLQLSAAGAEKMSPLRIVLQKCLAGQIAQGARSLDRVCHGVFPVNVLNTSENPCRPLITPHFLPGISPDQGIRGSASSKPQWRSYRGIGRRRVHSL